MPTSYRFVVAGRVQGVGFRQATARQARQMAIDGWVRNRADGAVEGLACSTNPATLDEFRHWLEAGPATARVDHLRWEPLEAAATIAPAGFAIRP